MFPPFVIVVNESLSCPQCENMDLKIIQSLLEGFKYTEDRNQRMCRSWRIYLKTAQDQQGTHEQLSQN